jgi:predicted dehydrogenase
MNAAIIGGNFGCNVILPAVLQIKKLNFIGISPSLTRNFSNKALHNLPKVNLISTEEILSNNAIDFVLVAIPPESQGEVILKLLKANKHIFAEKPISNSLEHAQLIANLANRPYKSSVDYTFFGIKEIESLREIVKFSAPIISYKFIWNCRSRSFDGGLASWRFNSSQGGGALSNLASHFIALLDVIFGEIQAVSANLKNHINQNNLSFDESIGNLKIIHKNLVEGDFLFDSYFDGPPEISLLINGGSIRIQLQNQGYDYFKGFKLYINGKEQSYPKELQENGLDSRVNPVKKLISSCDSGTILKELRLHKN